MDNPFQEILNELSVIKSDLQILKNINQAKPIEKEEFINLSGACTILGKAKSTIYALCNQKKLPHYSKGRQLYFLRSELITWVKEGEDKKEER